MPFTFHEIRTAGKALVLSLCLLSACAPQTSQLPTIPPSPPSDEGPHDDPARDAQVALLKEAYRAFVQERYPTAVLFFRRFVENSPDSPRLAEARWWLGRAHEQVGDFRAAMAQYRTIASGQLSQQLNGKLYEDHALRRLDELRQRQADQTGAMRQLALRVGAEQLPPMPGLTAWLQELVRGGVTSIVLEPGRSQTSRQPASFEIVNVIVAEAHRAGLAVWVALDIHQPQGWDLKPEWLAETVNGRMNEEASGTRRPDIVHPGYQASLEEMAKALARGGCDGLFFPARSGPGFSREFSGDSFQSFASSFSLSLSPQELFRDQPVDPLTQERPDYWRWVGWKALSYAKLAARLGKVLREHNPTGILLIEVHQMTLGAPLQGLEQYGEDIAELAQRTGGSIVVRREEQSGPALLEKLRQQLGTTERVWVEIPVAATASPSSLTELKSVNSELSEASRWHTIIMPRSAPGIP